MATQLHTVLVKQLTVLIVYFFLLNLLKDIAHCTVNLWMSLAPVANYAVVLLIS